MTEQTQERKRKGGIPPLVWIILALLVVWGVWAFMQRGGEGTTPGGGTQTFQDQGPSVMPPAPASGEGPATPGGVVNPEQ